MSDSQRSKRLGQCDIELSSGASIHLDTDDSGDVLLAIDLGQDRDGVMVRLIPPVAAYLGGQLAVRSGVKFG